MGHLDSQRSLPVLRDDKTGFSPMAKKLRLATGHTVAVLNSPAGYLALLNPGAGGRCHPGAAIAGLRRGADVREQHRRAAPPRARGDSSRQTGRIALDHISEGRRDPGRHRPARQPWWMRRDVPGEITSVTGYKPVAFVAIDDNYTALRFKRV